MKRDEFDRWLDDFCGFFPGVLTWMRNSDKVANAKAMRDGWFRRLQRYDYLLLGRVTNCMLDGTIEPIKAVDYPLFAHHIAAAAARLTDRDRRAAEKYQQSQTPEAGSAWRAATTGDCRAAFDAACHARVVAREQDMDTTDEDELVHWVVAAMMPDGDRHRSDAEQQIVGMGFSICEIMSGAGVSCADLTEDEPADALYAKEGV